MPSVVDIVKLSTKLHFCYGTGYVFYFILGWYLHNFPISHKRSICIGGVLGLMVTILGTIIFTGMNVESSYFFSNFSIGIFCTSVSVFVCVKSLFQDKEGPSFFVNLICSHSMGIYAMHMGVFPLFTYILKIKYAVLAIPVYFIFAVALPLVGSIVLRRIRIFRFLV